MTKLHLFFSALDLCRTFAYRKAAKMMQQAKYKIIDFQPAHQPFFEGGLPGLVHRSFPRPAGTGRRLRTNPAGNGDPRAKQGAILIATSGRERSAGFVCPKVNHSTYGLTKMAVHPDYRGKGVGEKPLCRAAIDRAEALGAKCLVLYSHGSLGPALHIYQKFGF